MLSGGTAISVAAPGSPALSLGWSLGIGCRDCIGVFGLLGSLVVLPGLFVLIGLEQVGGMEKGALFVTYVDESRLNARQDRFNAAKIDVSDHPAMVGTVNQQLDEAVVLED